MEARIKIDKMSGDVLLGKYLCRIICKHVGISEETYNQNLIEKHGVEFVNVGRD